MAAGVDQVMVGVDLAAAGCSTTSETLAVAELYFVVSAGVNVTPRASVPAAGTVPAAGV